MQTATSRDQLHTREGDTRPVKLALCNNHQYLTFSGECDCAPKNDKTKYAVIGTAYGWLHNSAGDIRMWNSASGARRAAKAYRCY